MDILQDVGEAIYQKLLSVCEVLTELDNWEEPEVSVGPLGEDPKFLILEWENKDNGRYLCLHIHAGQIKFSKILYNRMEYGLINNPNQLLALWDWFKEV